MRDIRMMNMTEGQKISSDDVMTYLGELNYRDFGVLSKVALFDQGTACIIGDGLRVEPSAGLVVNVPAGACMQRISSDDVLVCMQTEDQTVTIDTATGSPRTDLVEAQIKKVSDKTDNALTATVATGTNVVITNESIKRDIKYYLSARKLTNSTTPTAATAGVLTGTVAIPGTIDLSSRYKINLSDGEDGDLTEINLQGATPAATTAAEIVSNINAAVGRVMASLSGNYVVLTGYGTGETSYFKLKPTDDTDVDALEIVFGLSIGSAYTYEYEGDNEWFKLAEINMGAATTVLTGTEILDLDEKDSWASGGSDVLVRQPLFSGVFNGGAVFNEDSRDVDFRVESNSNANAFKVDGGTGVVTIGIADINSGNIDGTAIGAATPSTGAFTTITTTSTINGTKISLGGGDVSTNVSVCDGALLNNTTGAYNTAIGYISLQSNLTGIYNTSIGYRALTVNTASYNTAIGTSALRSNTTGSYNVAVGSTALDTATTGTQNTAIGNSSGRSITTGSNNTCLGDNANVNLGTAVYRTSIGAGSSNLNDNSIRLGRLSTDTTYGHNYQTDSDRRLKENIIDLELGLDFIETLRPVTYKWKNKKIVDNEGNVSEISYKREHAGFIAQDIGKALKKTGKDLGLYNNQGYNEGIADDDEKDEIDWNNFEQPNDSKSYSIEQLLAISVKAIQELSEKVKKLEEKINNA